VHYGDKPPADRKAKAVQERISSYAGAAQVTQAPAADRKAATPGQGSAQVVLYSAVWCKYCRQVKAYFATRGLRYDERDVEASASARREYEQLGGRGVPVILVGRQRMDGYDQGRLESMLRTEGL
jgi:glutaredoxin